MKLIIQDAAAKKLKDYVMSVESEIAGMGKVRIDEEAGQIIVEDVAIYDQEVTNGTADLSSAALASFMTEMIQRGESPRSWILWWHSHASMGAFFSSTDTGTIDHSTEFDHLVSLVVNRKGEAKCRIDSYRPFRMTRDNVEVTWGNPNYTVPEDVAAEVALKVKTKGYSNWTWRKPEEGKDSERETSLGFLGNSARGSEKKNEGGSHPSSMTDIEYKIACSNPHLLSNEDMQDIVDSYTYDLDAMKAEGQNSTPAYQKKLEEKIDWIVRLADREREEDEPDDLASLIDEYNGKHA